METDADRLESIKALGGQLVRHAAGEFWAIFDRDFAAVDGVIQVESRTPALTCRASDVANLAKDETLTLAAGEFSVKRKEPDLPAPGWTTVILKA